MEVARQLLHIAVGGFALVLPWLTWPQAALLALSAIVFNLAILPRLAPRVLRDADRRRPWTSGILLYPLAVLGLVLVFPSRLDLAATAWIILAAGDGSATLVGTFWPIAPLPWNRRKSFGGLAAFIVFGSLAAVGMTWWVSPGQADDGRVVLAIAAAVLAAFAETVPIRLDDNVTVPAVSAMALWSTTAMNPTLLVASLSALGPAGWTLLAVNGGVAILGWIANTVTGAGAVTGAIIGAIMIAAAGPGAWVLLIATFLLASMTTRLGHRRKAKSGIAEERGGRRGPGNAIANTGLAAWAALIVAGSADPLLPKLALVAALATAGSDTVASVVGKAWGRTAWLVTTWRRVPAGTTGAVSLEGTVAGIASAALLAWIGSSAGLLPTGAIPLVAFSATIASLMEGVIGATLEARGMLTNDVVNFVNSAMGAGMALLVWSSI
jgi:uncharacterized protein (TIGR00297 family)